MNQNEQELAYNVDIEEEILNRRVVDAVDVSIDERFIAAFWVIAALEERGKCVNRVTSSKWVNSATPEAEGLGLLNLVKEINNNTKHLTEGEITI